MLSPNRKKLLSTGILGDALLQTQVMIQDAYKGIRNLERKQGGFLRDSILRSSFKFSKFNPEVFFNQSNAQWHTQAGMLINKKNEILWALKKIDDIEDSITTEVDSFFSNLTELFEELKNSNDDQGLNLNWLVNQAQINRIVDLVDVIEAYDKKIYDIYSPMHEFLKTINMFFVDSNKELMIDALGRLYIVINKKSHKNYELSCLSSGERQLIIIVAQVLFNKYSGAFSSKKSIIIIDEPELSLHMRWQEMFSNFILEVSPETQFILATHSPDIVGDLNSKCKMVRDV